MVNLFNAEQIHKGFGVKVSKDDRLIEQSYILMRKLKIGFEELQKMPIPTYFILLELISKEEQARARELNKRKKRG